MKRLSNYIKEQLEKNTQLLMEGGNAIQQASKIPVNIAPSLYKEVYDIVKKHYPNVNMCPLGSLGKKKEGQTHGDIDIAFQCNNISELDEMLKKVFEPMVGKEVSEINYHTTTTTKSIGWKYKDNGEEKIAQVDFMYVQDMDWALFRYYSPDFTKNESQFKGALRSNLLRIIISWIPIKDNKIEYWEDGKEKSKFKYSMKDEGVYKQFISFTTKTGKRSFAEKPRKIKELEEFISSNPKEVMKFIFGEKCEPKDFNSLEGLWSGIHNQKKFPYDKEVIKNIEDSFRKEVERDLDIPYDDFIKILNEASK